MPFHNAYKQKGGNYKIKVKITVFLVPANCCQWSWRISNRQLARALDDSRALIAEKLILRSYRFIKLKKKENQNHSFSHNYQQLLAASFKLKIPIFF